MHVRLLQSQVQRVRASTSTAQCDSATDGATDGGSDATAYMIEVIIDYMW